MSNGTATEAQRASNERATEAKAAGQTKAGGKKLFQPGNKMGFKPGQSGNPQGGAVGHAKVVKDLFEQIGAELVSFPVKKRDKDGKMVLTGETIEMTRAKAVVLSLYNEAIGGKDVRAAQYVADRLWGKIKEHVMVEPVMQRQFIIQRSTDAKKQIDYRGDGNGNGGNGDDASVHPVA